MFEYDRFALAGYAQAQGQAIDPADRPKTEIEWDFYNVGLRRGKAESTQPTAAENAADVATAQVRLDDLASGKVRLVSGRPLQRRLAAATKAKKPRQPTVNHWSEFGSAETFAAYAKENWNAVGRDGGAFYITHDVAWLMRKLAKAGWPVRKTGRVERDHDQVRTFICPMPA